MRKKCVNRDNDKSAYINQKSKKCIIWRSLFTFIPNILQNWYIFFAFSENSKFSADSGIQRTQLLECMVQSISMISIIKLSAALWPDHGQAQVLAPSILPGHTKAEKTQAFGQYQHHPRYQYHPQYLDQCQRHPWNRDHKHWPRYYRSWSLLGCAIQGLEFESINDMKSTLSFWRTSLTE